MNSEKENMKNGSEFKSEDIKETIEVDYRLNLLYEVGRKIASSSQLKQLVERITRMTQQALKASASSVLLFDDGRQELLFKVAEGRARKQLKRVKLSTENGIAGWVARHGKPLIVNDVANDERFHQGIDQITGFATRSIICVPLIAHRRVIGVIEVLNKLDGSNFSGQDLEVLVSVASTSAMLIENVNLQENLLNSYKSTIKALAAAIDAKDPYTCGHSQRVMEYALLGGNSLALLGTDLEVIEYAGILHDIGKIGIADNILIKPGPLTDEEWETMRQHPLIGANILNEIPFLAKVKDIILYHHERYDGKGYPGRLRGEHIPMGARLLSVADTFDTITTDRSYRAARSTDYALEELHRCSGTQFCPVAVDAFISALEKA
ncbi:HD domain-containing phosphohydrolase [Chloroflexota bacterium]